MRKFYLLLLFALCAPAAAQAQTAADTAAIRGAALDYIEGWYTADATRMERALHPELAKRIVGTNAQSRRSRVEHMTAAELVQGTRGGGGRNTPAGQQRKEVRILDIFGNAASVRIDAARWVDYLHLGKVDGEWKIINVLWEMRAASR
jgi:hypothetical protein